MSILFILKFELFANILKLHFNREHYYIIFDAIKFIYQMIQCSIIQHITQSLNKKLNY